MHIEGTLEPDLMFELAQRNGVMHKLPFKSVAEAQAAYNFHNLQSFLDLYYAGCAVLLTKQACPAVSSSIAPEAVFPPTC